MRSNVRHHQNHLHPVKTALLKSFLSLTAVGLVGCSSGGDLHELQELVRPQLRFKDENVSVTYEPKLSINPHADQPNVLTVAGKRFPYVQGSAPYYCSFDNGRYILFSLCRAGMLADKTTLVVANLKTGQTQSLDISDHKWGGLLYSKYKTYRDTARQLAPGKVLLRHRCFNDSTELEVSLEPLKLNKWRKYRDGRIALQGP
jgi:hypothetical protein